MCTAPPVPRSQEVPGRALRACRAPSSVAETLPGWGGLAFWTRVTLQKCDPAGEEQATHMHRRIAPMGRRYNPSRSPNVHALLAGEGMPTQGGAWQHCTVYWDHAAACSKSWSSFEHREYVASFSALGRGGPISSFAQNCNCPHAHSGSSESTVPVAPQGPVVMEMFLCRSDRAALHL